MVMVVVTEGVGADVHATKASRPHGQSQTQSAAIRTSSPHLEGLDERAALDKKAFRFGDAHI
jgi:hypothetical protein